MNIEICTDSIDGAKLAVKYGAKRIELCSGLSIGGLTPSIGLVEKCTSIKNIEVHPIIRHREGNFNYSLEEIEIMKVDIEAFHKVGAAGVVFGVLNNRNEVSSLNADLVEIAKEMDLEVTFHRAFDFVPNYQDAIRKIIKLGFDRLLTSGLQEKAIDGVKIITQLQKRYGNEIQIMAGSGINSENVMAIIESGIENIHFTSKKTVSVEDNSMGLDTVVDEEKIRAISKLVKQ